MKIFLLTVLMALVACTKPNPNRCCTDEADCTSHNIPSGSTCGDGLLCRGNQCIAVSCTGAAECDLSAPYCVDSSCVETCSADDQCPGFQQAANEKYCVSGTCAECRADSPSDCSGAAPVCDTGACRACRAHSECASGVCAADGSCAAESSIAYVEPGGSDTTDCSRQTRCSLVHGISLARPYVLLATGTYTNAATLTIGGAISLIGAQPKPAITMSAQGQMIKIAPGDVSFENIVIRGATGSTNGDAIACANSNPPGTRRVRLIDVDVTQNAHYGVFAQQCEIDALRSTFMNNGFDGVSITDGSGTFDRCHAEGNAQDGINLDVGVYSVRNTFSVRNAGVGIDAYGNLGTVVEFCTVADNGLGGVSCGVPGTIYPNNLIVRNGTSNTTSGCTYPSSIITDNITGLMFKSPDVAPYDYHIGAGSLAIDQSTLSTVDIDYDGDARPQGAGKDVGADEYVP